MLLKCPVETECRAQHTTFPTASFIPRSSSPLAPRLYFRANHLRHIYSRFLWPQRMSCLSPSVHNRAAQFYHGHPPHMVGALPAALSALLVTFSSVPALSLAAHSATSLLPRESEQTLPGTPTPNTAHSISPILHPESQPTSVWLLPRSCQQQPLHSWVGFIFTRVWTFYRYFSENTVPRSIGLRAQRGKEG